MSSRILRGFVDNLSFIQETASSGGLLRPAHRSALHKDLAGYNAARGDFDWESDNLAEMELNVIEANDDLYRLMTDEQGQYDIDFAEICDTNGFESEDDFLVASLSSAALQVHNERLKKRLKRKKIVKEYGLLNKARDLGLPGRYEIIYRHLFIHTRGDCQRPCFDKLNAHILKRQQNSKRSKVSAFS